MALEIHGYGGLPWTQEAGYMLDILGFEYEADALAYVREQSETGKSDCKMQGR